MRLKEGVGFVELHPAIRYGVLVIEEETRRETGRGVIVTSFQESFDHSKTSLHYGITYQGRKTMEADDRCRAVDVDLDEFSQAQKDVIEKRARARLGRDFDLVVESTHWHLEYDPK